MNAQEGVVKRSWLEKMCNTIPAVLLLCIDWTVDLSQPQEAQPRPFILAEFLESDFSNNAKKGALALLGKAPTLQAPRQEGPQALHHLEHARRQAKADGSRSWDPLPIHGPFLGIPV